MQPGDTVADEVITALEAQVDCYQRLCKLAQIQHDHVQHSRTEALLEVLAQRQAVLDQVGALERAIVPARRQWASYLSTLKSDQRARAQRLLEETRRLLEEITQADRNDALILQQRKLNLGKQITQATAARQVNRNYAASAYGSRKSGMDLKQ